MFSLLAPSDLQRRRANCCPPPTRRGWNLTTPPSPAFLRWPPAKNSFAFKAVQSVHIRIKEENDNGTQTAQYAVQTYFEYWILQCPIPRISKYWILQYIQNQKYQHMVAGARSTSRANARSLGLVSLRPQRIGDYHQFTIIFFINIIIKIITNIISSSRTEALNNSRNVPIALSVIALPPQPMLWLRKIVYIFPSICFSSQCLLQVLKSFQWFLPTEKHFKLNNCKLAKNMGDI